MSSYIALVIDRYSKQASSLQIEIESQIGPNVENDEERPTITPLGHSILSRQHSSYDDRRYIPYENGVQLPFFLRQAESPSVSPGLIRRSNTILRTQGRWHWA